MTRRRLLLAAALLASCAAAALLLATRPAALPSPEQVRAAWRPSDSVLLDRHGAPLQELRLDFSVRRYEWTPLDQVSPALTAAVIAAEDRRFQEHRGVDLLALAAAARDSLRGRGSRGASTLTMQLAARLAPGIAAAGRRGLRQKIRQMRAAWALERNWSKPQILEAYLNLVSFRGESQGIAAASRMLFDAAPSALTAPQSAILAALLRAPRADIADVSRRACRLAMQVDAKITDCTRIEALTLAALQTAPTASAAWTTGLAPHAAQRLLREAGVKLRSTLDAGIQRLALTALRAQLSGLSQRGVRDGAVVVMDNASGDVLAYVGSVASTSRAAQVDGAKALRQAGSTLKPFLYGLALERGYLTAASLLDDSPVALETGAGLYIPQNYDHEFRGVVSARTALAGSLNVPAVRVLGLVGLEPFRDRLHGFGYDGLTESGEFYGYSLALGSAEVSLLQQVNAYRALANGGAWSPPRFLPDAPAAATRQAMSPQATWIVTQILSDRAARAGTFGLSNPLSTPYWSAAKTGTSKHMRDNWCLGWSTRYSVGVWVGNFEGQPMGDVSGVDGAAPAWRNIMDALHENLQAPPPTPPPGVVQQQVRYADGVEASRSEWFLSGTETALVTTAAPQVPRLASPPDGMIVALDPDIPPDRQHVLFRAQGPISDSRFAIDGTPLAAASKPYLWAPQPGAHVLELIDAEGRRLDQVKFQVR